MKIKLLILTLCFGFISSAFAEEVIRIEVGTNYKKYSNSDLQRRVFELERAVMQLQQRVFQLEGKPSTPVSDSWACTLTAMGETYTATGGSKAVASVNVVEKCAAARKDRFFCKDPKCEN